MKRIVVLTVLFVLLAGCGGGGAFGGSGGANTFDLLPTGGGELVVAIDLQREGQIDPTQSSVIIQNSAGQFLTSQRFTQGGRYSELRVTGLPAGTYSVTVYAEIRAEGSSDAFGMSRSVVVAEGGLARIDFVVTADMQPVPVTVIVPTR